jgi:hypothetical protein
VYKIYGLTPDEIAIVEGKNWPPQLSASNPSCPPFSKRGEVRRTGGWGSKVGLKSHDTCF